MEFTWRTGEPLPNGLEVTPANPSLPSSIRVLVMGADAIRMEIENVSGLLIDILTLATNFGLTLQQAKQILSLLPSYARSYSITLAGQGTVDVGLVTPTDWSIGRFSIDGQAISPSWDGYAWRFSISLGSEKTITLEFAPAVVQPQLIQGVLAAIMAVWMAAYVFSQVVKGIKGEEVERPPLV